MTEGQVVAFVLDEFRRRGLTLPTNGKEMDAFRAAARRIVAEADMDRRAAARTASLVGFSVTRGRTHL